MQSSAQIFHREKNHFRILCYFNPLSAEDQNKIFEKVMVYCKTYQYWYACKFPIFPQNCRLYPISLQNKNPRLEKSDLTYENSWLNLITLYSHSTIRKIWARKGWNRNKFERETSQMLKEVEDFFRFDWFLKKKGREGWGSA